MLQTIEFNSEKDAQNVAEHLYGVSIQNSCLVFKDFDQEAFELAVGLEGLDDTAYQAVRVRGSLAAYGRTSSNPLNTIYRAPRWKLSLELDYIGFSHLFNLSPIITPDKPIIGSQDKDNLSFFLQVDADFVQFFGELCLLKHVQDYLGELPSARVANALLTVKGIKSRQNPLEHLLTISDGDEVKRISFYASKTTLENTAFETW